MYWLTFDTSGDLHPRRNLARPLWARSSYRRPDRGLSANKSGCDLSTQRLKIVTGIETLHDGALSKRILFRDPCAELGDPPEVAVRTHPRGAFPVAFPT